MILAMFLAHLAGDYIFQWDGLARWKSREFKGVLAHGLVITGVTTLFALPFRPFWWSGVIVISATHLAIDSLPLWLPLPFRPLGRFLLDQSLHILVIFGMLGAGGYLDLANLGQSLATALHDNRTLVFLLGYTFITLPTWVFVKFIAYGLVRGTGPDFVEGSNRYIGIFERVMITTLVLFGQFLLVPIVAIPGLLAEWPRIADSERAPVYLVEVLASMTAAICTGLILSHI